MEKWLYFINAPASENYPQSFLVRKSKPSGAIKAQKPQQYTAGAQYL